MRSYLHLALLLALLTAIGACHRFHHDDDDVVVTSEELAPLGGGCLVRGTVRNDGDHRVRVFITWRAFDRDDDRIGTADVEIPDLPRDGTRSFESTRFREFDGDLIPCNRIARFRHDTSVFRD